MLNELFTDKNLDDKNQLLMLHTIYTLIDNNYNGFRAP